MPISIPQAVQQMLSIVDQLQKAYPKKKFTLDGRLVGDIGEMLVEEAYDVEVFEDLQRQHDGRTTNGRLVQIKATMKDALTFPADHIPNFYLGIKIHKNGTFSEVFNGPGAIASEAVKNRKRPKTNLHTVGVATLAALSGKVADRDRIALRPNNVSQPTPLKRRR